MTETEEGGERCRTPDPSVSAEPSAAPARAGLVLISLILVAAVANLNLAVANVALPEIGKDFDSSQTALDLIAVGYSLGLAASVLWLGALGDRYGRKTMLVLGVSLSVPACLLAAWAPSDTVLFIARLVGGISAGMAYPTTLALITALWSGQPRTRSIALWSAIGGAIAALGPLVAGALLEHFWWGSVFLVTLPLAAVALVLALAFVPSHVNETTDPVDNLGGILSVLLVGALILAINFAPVPDKGSLAIGLGVIAVAAGTGLRHPTTPRSSAAVRPPHRRPSNLLGRGMRGDHRVRIPHGRHVHRPAIPPERARLRHPRRRARHPPRGGDDGAHRTPLREADRRERIAVHAAHRIRLLLPRLSHHAAPLEGEHRVLEGRSRIRVHRRRRRIRRDTRIALAHRIRAACGAPGWHPAPPTSNETSAAPSCSPFSVRS